MHTLNLTKRTKRSSAHRKMLHTREQSQTVTILLNRIVHMPRFTKTTPQVLVVSPQEKMLLSAPEETAPHGSRHLPSHRQPLPAAIHTLPDKTVLYVGDYMSLL